MYENKMICNLLFQLLNRFKIASDGFRKILAVFATLMFFGLILAVIKFTNIDIPNITRNLGMLAIVDLGGFLFLNWKRGSSPEPLSKEVKEDNQNYNQEDIVLPPENPKIERVQELEKVQKKLSTEDEDKENEVEKLMNEIIEENKERLDEMEKEMGIQ